VTTDQTWPGRREPVDLHVRPYSSGDEAELAAVWNEALPPDPMAPELFYQKTVLDSNFQPENIVVAKADQAAGGDAGTTNARPTMAT
jgi:hypothetical protein